MSRNQKPMMAIAEPRYEFDFDRSNGSGQDHEVQIDARTCKVIPDNDND